ncbi:hypothetical protein A2662_03640 [Candidatus Giovannonibacteria bacterium RIFCSPHIGHO2_01_FULL_45_33]|uniref:Uncharacterized protein n=1 Tax=Candidatus Giovannonibacteria bacterium RIFCSPLOWO2_01_FULL_45_34 TaxID=1798351 RepID=A0A1F5WYK0_9BACT|nr:MAG: hypothetical protein A2662_03640 [Candidatus Giovannonibacteria bacterium RIFCSPHIGHO2_01_FULL_45_33]OGF70888.1 MAG: hypothetical protein A3C73_04805 [Candidatus Giovannonibacteria bacterium RIFCSPHIGHO2_02_FULL_44_11]OGF80735.1 MAG: hypothetical protein A2930_03675 [Candidatus Giovannonibacteria bacterium RIFCSPLOWO2_01_FULL_45_34]
MSTEYFVEATGELLGTVRVTGPYCCRCEVSLVTKKSGGVNVPDPRKVSRERVNVDRCPRCLQKRCWYDQIQQSIGFYFAMPARRISRFHPDTPVVDGDGLKMTIQSFSEEIIDMAKFLFSAPGVCVACNDNMSENGKFCSHCDDIISSQRNSG